MTQHAPGPWQIVHGYTALRIPDGSGIPDGFGIMAESAPDLICECGLCGNVAQATINLANARLIAAAPDLLEACKTAIRILQPSCRGRIDDVFGGAVLEKLGQAIAKATEAPNPTQTPLDP